MTSHQAAPTRALPLLALVVCLVLCGRASLTGSPIGAPVKLQYAVSERLAIGSVGTARIAARAAIDLETVAFAVAETAGVEVRPGGDETFSNVRKDEVRAIILTFVPRQARGVVTIAVRTKSRFGTLTKVIEIPIEVSGQ